MSESSLTVYKSSKKLGNQSEYFPNSSDEGSKSLSIIKRIAKNKNDQNDQKNNSRRQKVNWVEIQFTLKQKNIFELTGHIVTEINPDENTSISLNVKAVENCHQEFIIHQHSLETITQFDQIVYMLEKSQSQQYYSMAQQLKRYQCLVENSCKTLKVIKESQGSEYLEELVKERNLFKDLYIKEYTKENFLEEDFYIVCNVGTNIDKNCSNMNNVRFSKSYFALLGVDESLFENIFFRKYLMFLALPPRSRQQYFFQLVQSYMEEQPYRAEIVLKGFEFQTIDEIPIVCEMKTRFIKIPYPENLKHQELDQLHLLMDNIAISIFDIRDYHIQNVISKRQSLQTNNLEDFEYSMLAEIFLQKHYPKQLLCLKQEGNLPNNDDLVDEQKRCSFRHLF